MSNFITVDDITSLFRSLSNDEKTRAEALIPIVCDSLRMEAIQRGYDLDAMIDDGDLLENVLKSVCVDVVARTLLTSTTSEPMTNYSEGALGYTYSGTFLNPGGGLFIKESELYRLGINVQRIGLVEL